MSRLELKEFISLREYNTFRIESKGRYYLELKNKNELKEAYNFIKYHDLNYFVLGGGSNILLPELFNGLVIHNQIKGINVTAETSEYIYIRAGAGLKWDDFISECLELGYYGLENLSYIPGTVGASPVQNISAYGVEVKEFIDSVELFDMSLAREVFFKERECYFSYRNSVFKSNPNLIVTAVNFKLNKRPKLNLTYRDVAEHLKKSKTATFTPKDLRDLIVNIRKNKLPDPELIPNAGSFFHNPIVDKKVADSLLKDYDIPTFNSDHGKVKLSAGWLIENAGLKGFRLNNVGVYDKHALVLVNYAGATQKEILDFSRLVKDKVYEKYKVRLSIEPIIIT
ncbi:MAG TPA: UDP-N-acetylmuramate dehydrogenase [Lentisphaeria bacterium]|nr:MAG: UDP-N-acetylenolpyruvoylglucosamine reductase [Lentisphaerae bacterium GWF2_38_69]HBM17357.1 UDP-N-acetylmuramate dehydrogenase [Lentisphaeria bacterium]